MSDDSAVWKDKYFKSLEELESKEKTWAGLETLLRSAVSRMSIALSGIDENLDDQLGSLRKCIRDSQDNAQLDRIMRQITDRLEIIEAERQQENPHDIGAVFEQLVAQIELPRGTARASKAFQKSLKRYRPGDPVEELRGSFVELIKQALIESEALAKDTDKTAKEKGGWLFSRLRKSSAEPAEESPADVATARADVIDELNSGRRVLAQLIDGLNRAGLQISKDTLSSVNRAKLQSELDNIAAGLSSQLGGTAVPAANLHAEEMSLNEAFLRLLELIELDEEGATDLEALQTRLHEDVADEEWPEVLADIAALVTGMRNKVQDEKKEFEDFLSELTTRLGEVDASFKLAEDDRKESYQRGVVLGETVRDHVQDIESDVRDANDLDLLKTRVQQRMDLLDEHMRQFRDEEDGRNSRAEARIEELNERLRQMEQETGSLRQRVIDERERARRDRLTGLYNRYAYDERMAQEYARWQRYREALSLLVMDIDFFKKINDSFGHMAGDKVLRAIAVKLNESVRETDVLARFGGEEFVLIMPATALPEAEKAAEKCREAVAGMGFHFRDQDVPITVSVGVTSFTEQDDPAKVFERADKALYQAKQTGRNRCQSL